MGLLASFLRCRCLEPSEKRGAAAATAVTDAAALTSGRDARELRGAERAAPGAAAADRAAESDLPKGAKELTLPEDAAASRQSDKTYMGEYGVTVRQFPSPDVLQKERLKQATRTEEPSEEPHFAGLRVAA